MAGCRFSKSECHKKGFFDWGGETRMFCPRVFGIACAVLLSSVRANSLCCRSSLRFRGRPA